MYKQKIGISVGYHYAMPTPDVIKMLKNIGFDAISVEWSTGPELAEAIETARESGMIVESLHAPFWNAAKMWSADEAVGDPAEEELLRALEDCKTWNIPIMVVHTWIGFEYEFDASALYFKHFDALVAKAEAYGITIAFENVEGEEYLAAIMERYADKDIVGFCWDSGHEMCFNRSQDLLAKYGDRLVMTHLNDNLGISRFDGTLFWKDDLHLLPYDGVADWDDNVQRLAKVRPLDILNFELIINSKPDRHENDQYQQMPLELYFTEVYKRACKIAYRYAKAKVR
ncbi:MAG: sugar phosphate isomerase/epimerase [Oscillospiraceae bacterium]|nr:sugar phosphate isomerase/epimerase [Oscillospiraceae bacterium]